MSFRTKRILSTIALLVAFAAAQIYLPVSLANLGGNTPSSPQAGAVLATGNNQPITVNGMSAISGATILSGASIETPGQVGATVNFPGHFSLEIGSDAKLVLEFNADTVKVTVIRGCVKLNTKKGTSGEVVNEMGQSLGKTDPSEDNDDVKFCEPKGALPTSPAATTGGGMSGGTLFGIVGSAAADAALLYAILTGDERGENPSPSTP